MPTEIIDINGIKVEFTRKRVKNINLRVSSDGKVKVSAPMYVNRRTVEEFVKQKSDWITKVRLSERKKAPRRPNKKTLALYRKNLESRAPLMLSKAAEATGLSHGEICYKYMKTRWGSCNVKTGKICFNLRLCQFDDRILYYVALHEILHTKYPNHGAQFKAALTKYLPEWKSLRKELNKGTKNG